MSHSTRPLHRAPDGEPAEEATFVAETTFVSVDVETAGPNPTQYSLLSIGACLVFSPKTTFYVELQPVHLDADPQAISISELSLEQLAAEGIPPVEAMARFDQWIKDNVPAGTQPLFCGFNAPFDWMFVSDYFHRYLGRNPFGYAALDIKSYYMGMKGVPWSETSLTHLLTRYLNGLVLSHNALQDALDQAALFRKLLAEAPRPKSEI